VFAAYYGWLAAGLFHSAAASTRLGDAPAGIAGQAGDPDQELLAGLQQAQSSGRPVFIDFQASWCKNCAAMEETVFNRTDVQKRLGDFVVVKYRAERPNEAPARDVLDHFGALGLPTYVVLAAPVTRPAASPTSTPTP